MGNRAVITTQDNYNNNGIGIYLHWNGGRDSVEAFLDYCSLKGYRSPSADNYGWARLCQVISNFFGGNSSIGIDTINNLDCNNGDNGTYFIDGWHIVGRANFVGKEQNSYTRAEMLKAIDDAQPESEKLGGLLTAKTVKRSELMPGDKIYLQNPLDKKPEVVTVIGCGQIPYCNGHKVFGIPFVDRYGKDRESQENNPNNYLFDEEYKLFEEPEQDAEETA